MAFRWHAQNKKMKLEEDDDFFKVVANQNQFHH